MCEVSYVTCYAVLTGQRQRDCVRCFPQKSFAVIQSTINKNFPQRYGLLLFGHLLSVASNENSSSWDARNIPVFGIEASCFENWGSLHVIWWYACILNTDSRSVATFKENSWELSGNSVSPEESGKCEVIFTEVGINQRNWVFFFFWRDSERHPLWGTCANDPPYELAGIFSGALMF